MANKVFHLLDRNNNGFASASEIQAIFDTWLDMDRDGVIKPQEMFNATEELFGRFCEDSKFETSPIQSETNPGLTGELTTEEKNYLE